MSLGDALFFGSIVVFCLLELRTLACVIADRRS